MYYIYIYICKYIIYYICIIYILYIIYISYFDIYILYIYIFLELAIFFKVARRSLVCDFVESEGGENEIINSAGNTPDTEEKHGNGNINNIATYKGERLEGKFVSSNVINISRRNLPEAEISLLSKALKFSCSQ